MPPRLSNWSCPASQVPPGCPNDLCLPPWSLPAGRCCAELWPAGTSWAVQMVFRWPLAVSRASEIKSGLGRLLESVGLSNLPCGAVAQNPFLKALVVQIPLLKQGARGLAILFRNPISDGRNFSTPSMAHSRAHGKSQGEPHGRLPVALLSCKSCS